MSTEATATKKTSTKKKPNPAAKQAVKGKVAKLVPPKEKPIPKQSAEEKLAATVSNLIDTLRDEGDTTPEELDAIAQLGNGEVEGKPATEDSTAPAVIEVPNESKNLLIMYKPWCFRCTALVGTDETRSKELKPNKTCHYMNGNEHCPAKNNRLILGVPVEETAKALFDATTANDLDKDLEIRTRLRKFDPIMQKKVLELYRSMLLQAQ